MLLLSGSAVGLGHEELWWPAGENKRMWQVPRSWYDCGKDSAHPHVNEVPPLLGLSEQSKESGFRS